MFFLLRTAFWLGLTFSAMEWPGAAPVPPTVDGIAAQATLQAAKLCAGTPRACLEAARAFSGAKAASETPAAPGKPAKKKADTLDSADRAPAWRGRG